jgi:HEAT repeat protein
LPSTPSAATEGAGQRRRTVAAAGHTGDLTLVTAGLDDDDPRVRATALGALARLGRLDPTRLAAAFEDVAAIVRRRACELAPAVGPETVVRLIDALADPDDRVIEAACFGLGEVGVDAAAAVSALVQVAGAGTDPLCREAAVAALGAIGDPAGLPAIIAATSDKPAVRRRAVLALAPFEGPEVDATLQRALQDRDWQVRQAAEDLTGIT